MSIQDFGWSPFFAQQLSVDEQQTCATGRVTSIHRTGLVVNDGEREHSIPLGGSWFQLSAEDRPTVGDFVLLDSGRTKVARLLERKTVFKRVAAGETGEVQLIAANVDTLFVVTSCNAEFNESRLERYLTLAWESGVMPVVVLSKSDLVDDRQAYADRARAVSREVPVEVVNSLADDTLGGVRAWMGPGQTVALVGSSGVGKSTLLNTLAGSEIQDTGGVREDDQHGRHTTTNRSLHLLDDGGLMLDVPGMRELAIADAASGIAETFDDIESLVVQCRFADCAHHGEPGCAVRRAIDDDLLDERRFASYEKLLREEARNTATLAERREASRRWGKDHKRWMKERKRFEQQ